MYVRKATVHHIQMTLLLRISAAEQHGDGDCSGSGADSPAGRAPQHEGGTLASGEAGLRQAGGSQQATCSKAAEVQQLGTVRQVRQTASCPCNFHFLFRRGCRAHWPNTHSAETSAAGGWRHLP